MKEKTIEIAHGAGGLKMDQLLELIKAKTKLRSVSSEKGNLGMDGFDDGAIISKEILNNHDLVVSTDGHTVDPIFFPGGDIGKLAMCGTINDVVMMGARPIAITSAIVIEEGFTFKEFEQILASMNDVSESNSVAIIAGDTKVVPKGIIDKIMLVTTGIGVRIAKEPILDSNTRVGDKIIVTGPVGSHGIALMSFRQGMEFETTLQSDVASLASLLLPMIQKYEIHTMKDPTRGGLASALNEIASKSGVSFTIKQTDIPIDPAVKSASELLGLDPLEITSEGKAIITCPESIADMLVADLHQHLLGKEAKIIGFVTNEEPGKVFLETEIGGKRRLQKPVGELIPRVC
jgi:hydrogenase expression/formation protein HypE